MTSDHDIQEKLKKSLKKTKQEFGKEAKALGQLTQEEINEIGNETGNRINKTPPRDTGTI